MIRATVLLLCAGFCFAAQPPDDAVKKELKLFQGNWICIGGTDINGKPLAEDARKNLLLIVDGNKFQIKEKGAVSIEGAFSIDPAKKLKTIDVKLKDTNDIFPGIYQIDGDTRKSCFAVDMKSRPDAFRKEAGYLYLEWKRAK